MSEQTAATGCVCPFCGHSAASTHGASIHRVRCSKNPDRRVWSRVGVRNGTAKRREAVERGDPTSYCCDAPVHTGKAHDIGNRYCTKCGDPCYWRSNRPLAVSWACKTNGCRSQVPGRNGYCFGCSGKQGKPDLEDDAESDMI